MGYQIVTWPPKVLWGSTVGYPSDSLASGCYMDLYSQLSNPSIQPLYLQLPWRWCSVYVATCFAQTRQMISINAFIKPLKFGNVFINESLQMIVLDFLSLRPQSRGLESLTAGLQSLWLASRLKPWLRTIDGLGWLIAASHGLYSVSQPPPPEVIWIFSFFSQTVKSF